ncbi:UDP-N-acetylglucosamine 1-carboxyvinyltransferase [Atopostipes suicloacalis DSM 15692]|uniref:UDP-N-acetylglucosamine 1-carboxyvinyltransferase n=1 Tax=Atopostipes suicloacalis DSM 15692 TaxID=1121025 RepID=A0A1M4U7D3_9LACT|nr:UDP-N-acetylglucosamine 1-carboxyvinyltransferase [Atopostipes suicloacalis]SHE52553.1 UDP-N-acetylglucosamine 1-carboxyvinyltransferase [Atopostipes suicloacalis DSM 15692]
MDSIIVKGGNRLTGTVEIEGAKNAALPILAASILGEQKPSKFTNIPLLSDVYIMKEVLQYLNIAIDFNEDEKTMSVDATMPLKSDTPFKFMNKMRASIVVMGPLLARNGRAYVAMPGGCSIGSRPIDLHLKGFEAMGAKIEQGNGYLEATVDQLQGADIYLDFPSVGATQNIMMAATLAKGETTIDNAAREPEIVDLANYLNLMGAKVVGAGTETIRIEGVSELTGTNHSIIPDRIESGTYMVAAAITEGDVLIEDCVSEHNRPLISKLREMGVTITEEEKGVRVIGPKELKPTDIKTQPYPGYPTDMQAQMTIAQLKAKGTSVVNETVFENRFMHLEQMRKMNADFLIDGQSAIINGGKTLEGAEVASTDLRASAALILAGLIAEGYTRVTAINHLDRGYYKLHEKFAALGANIERVSGTEEKVAEKQEV